MLVLRTILTEAGKPDQKYDLFEMFPKIREEQNVEYLTKKAMQIQAEQDKRAEAQLGINQQNADSIKAGTDSRTDPAKQAELVQAKEQAKINAKRKAQLHEQVIELEDVAYKINDLEALLDSSEMITGNTLSAGFERMIGKQLGNKAYSDTELYDSISKGLLSFVKGNVKFGNMNLKEFEFLERQTPDSHKTKAALKQQITRFKNVLERQMKRNEAEMRRIPSSAGEPIRAEPTAASSDLGKQFMIVNPETGEEATISEQYLDAAVAGGWQVKGD